MSSRPLSVPRRTHPFAQALRRAIDTRGLTLTRFHERLVAHGATVSMATLSSWRSGARLPEGPRSLEVVAVIEQVLGLPTGALSALIGPSYRTGRIGDALFPWDDQALARAATELHEELGAEFPPPVRELSTSAVTDAGADGAVVRRTTRTLLQATAEIAAYSLLEVMPWLEIPPPSFAVLSGGRIGATASHPSGRVHGALIELQQPLAAGATTMLEVSVEFSPDGPAVHETGHGAGRSIRELLLWIRFPAEALPDWCNVVEETPDNALAVSPMILDRGGSGHALRRNFGPGALGVHWGYDGIEPVAPFRELGG